MQQQFSGLPVYLALILAIVAAIMSAPANGADLDSKLLWVLRTQAVTEVAPSNMDELQTLGMP